ncbi:TPA_asm: L [Gleditsia betacytorhabdovirus 1]|nr:TPA_asm: L [Gleditsia betacytorhabdovirus 1]
MGGIPQDSYLSSIIENMGVRRTNSNMTGLGDFHLRSAVKNPNLTALKRGKGRPREKLDYLRFIETVCPENVEIGDNTLLLSYFMIFLKGKIASEMSEDVRQSNLLKARLCKRFLSTRCKMEVNRDQQDLSDSTAKVASNEGTSFREKLLSGITHSEESDWENIRSYMERFVLMMNNISSKRSTNGSLRDYFCVREEETQDGSKVPIQFGDTIGNLSIVGGGDLVFIRIIESEVQIDSKSASWIDYNQYNCSSFRRLRRISDNLNLLTGSEFLSERGVVVGGSTWYCYSADFFRMICDKVSERDIVSWCCKTFSEISPAIYPSHRTLDSMFMIGDILLWCHGNYAYKLIKCYEALMTGVLLRRCNSSILSVSEFADSTMHDIIEECSDFREFSEDWVNLASSMSTDHHVSQLYGLYRLWGHPIIDSVEGLKKVKRLGTTKKSILMNLAGRARCKFKEMIYIKYRAKIGKYPDFSLSEDIVREAGKEKTDVNSGSYLVDCLIKNISFDNNKEEYLLSDWELVTTRKVFDIPATFNLTMVVDDKAISPPRSHLIKSVKKMASYNDPYEKRGVLKWMNSDYTECEKFLRDVSERSLPIEDCIIGLYPKERELNSVPRMFSLMSARMRNYIVVTEHMIADSILPYFPQITMTDDLLSLTKKIYSTTRTQEKCSKDEKRNIKEVSVCINMDFEKWNLNMRKESTGAVFEEMGNMFGLPDLFNRTYDIFENSYIYVCDESHDIRIGKGINGEDVLIPDGVHSYTGHVGGLEGLRQKGWTVFTVVMIDLVLEKFPVSYKLMGQGDNQVLMLILKTSDVDEQFVITESGSLKLKILLDRILQSLENTFLSVGLPLKTLESWKSEEFFLYGKFPVKAGVPLSMSLKKISRAFPFSNDDIMTLDNVLGSIFTNAQSAAMMDATHHIPYYCGLKECYRGIHDILNWHPMIGTGFFSWVEKMPHWSTYEFDNSKGKDILVTSRLDSKLDLHEFASALASLPKSLGGTNGLTEYEFLMRGFPDNQTRDMTYLTEIIKFNERSEDIEIRSIIRCLRRFVRLPLSKSKNIDFLVEDPCAINIKQPQTPLVVMRKKIKRVLGQTMQFRNKNFMELFSLTQSEKRRDLLAALGSQDRLFPRILHDCYSASLYGFVDGIVSKVDKTVTIQRMCLESANEDIILGMCNVEANYIKYLYWRSSHMRKRISEEPYLDCPTNYVRWSRNYGWGKEVLGVTTPYPSHILKRRESAISAYADSDNYVSCFVSDYVPTSHFSLLGKLGGAPPYLGSYTKEKIKKYEKIALYSSEPLLGRIVKMIKMLSWGDLEQSNLADYLRNVLGSVCDVDFNTFLVNKDHVGGSLEHRYQDMALKHGALSSNMYGLGTWIHLCTDTLTKYSKGGDNYTIHFQALLCWCQSSMYELLMSCDQDLCCKEFRYGLRCEKCILPIDYAIPDVGEIDKNLIPNMKGNPYCYTTGIRIQERDMSAINDITFLGRNNIITLERMEGSDYKILYNEIWAHKILADIEDESTKSTESKAGLFEMGKYPRTPFLKLNLKMLLNMISFMLARNNLDQMFTIDRWSEKENSFSGALQRSLSQLKRKSYVNFVGLAPLLTWSEKVTEIEKEYPGVYPRTSSPSTKECCQGGKNLMIRHLREIIHQNDKSWIPKYSKYLNEEVSTSKSKKLSLRLLAKHIRSSEESCRDCRQNIVKLGEIEDFSSLSTVCGQGHPWINLADVVKKYEIIYIPEDVIRKKMMNTDLVKIATKTDKGCIDIDLMKKLKQCISTIYHPLSKKDSKFLEGNLIYNYEEETYHKFYSRSSLYREINYDLSSGYKIVESLLIARLPRLLDSDRLLILGDGFGNTGRILSMFYNNPIVVSSLVDCTKSYPQTFSSSAPSGLIDAMTDPRCVGKIDCSMEKSVICDVFSDKFIETISGNLFKFLVSDIELEHEESKPGSYGRLLYNCYKTGIKDQLIKLRVENSILCCRLTNFAMNLFEEVKLLITPMCSNKKGEFFLHCHGPKDITDYEHKCFAGSTYETFKLVFEAHLSDNIYNELPTQYYNMLNDLIIDDNIFRAIMENLTSWLEKIGSKLDDSFSNYTSYLMGYSAKRNVKEMLDRFGDKDRYEYPSDTAQLGARMVALGLSYVKDDALLLRTIEHLDEFFVYLDSMSDGSGINNYTYSVKRAPTGRPSGKCVAVGEIPEICRFVPLLRRIRSEQGELIHLSGLKEIKFGYLKGIEKALSTPKDVIVLPVSKTLSRSGLRVI